MWTALTALGINKWIMYCALIFVATGLIAGVFLAIKKQGADQERTKQLTDALKTLGQEVKHRQQIEAMKTSEAKAKLKQRWSKR